MVIYYRGSELRRIKLTLRYDGTAYNGWQTQPKGITIQGLLQEAVFRLTGERVLVAGSGRTDAGVHALGQVAAFSSGSSLQAAVIKRGLNALLPVDIRVTSIEEADLVFHPRYDAKLKKYFYLISNAYTPSVFMRHYFWHVKVCLNVKDMQSAADCIVGTHDFSSFRGAGCGAKELIKTIHGLAVETVDEAAFFLPAGFAGELIKITITADGFLRHMVRNIVGTLVEVGIGRMAPEMAGKILRAKDRRLAGPTAPAKGLFLEKVIYSL